MALTQIQKGMIANGAVDNTKLDVATLDGTGGAQLPSGTTAQRPGSSVAGMTRFNTTLGTTEVYNGSAWQQIVPAYSVIGCNQARYHQEFVFRLDYHLKGLCSLVIADI